MKIMDGNEQELEEAYLEMPDTRSEILLQCYNAIAAVDTIDPYSASEREKKRNIQIRCLDIIDYYITEIHEEIFYEETQRDDN